VAEEYDVCVIGSGAGGGPVARSLAEAGYSVCVLEKGPWFRTEEFDKDEIGSSRRNRFEPDRRQDPHVWQHGEQPAVASANGWNGVLVGGSSVLMSGFFYRLKPEDFRLRSEFGPVEGSTVADWPITYDDLEPWYAKVEQDIGVSGRVTEHPGADRRSTPDYPYPPLREHPFAGKVDEACERLGWHAHGLARAVLSRDVVSKDGGERKECSYSRYCASFGCATAAKGSSLVTCIEPAVRTGRCTVRDRAMVRRLFAKDRKGPIVAAEYLDAQGTVRRVEARVFVVACQAIETARLLLLSDVANSNGMVGRNLLFSTFAAATADFPYAEHGEWLRSEEPFVHRSVDDFATIDAPGLGRRKGGNLNFLLLHGNPIQAAWNVATRGKVPLWGAPLKERLKRFFTEEQHLKCEVFADYTPTPEGRVMLNQLKDRWGLTSAHVRVVRHPRDVETARFLADKGVRILEAMGGRDVWLPSNVGGESTNLVAGTCRFGKDPNTSVLDPDCRSWDHENLYVTDGSFIPTGGSVPYTMTIYANAFRVADRIVASLGGPRSAPKDG
jgi:choline dehydrogenase-like flavoprotein